MSLEQKECKKITSSKEKGIDKFKVDALFAFFIDEQRKKEGRSLEEKRGTVLGRKKEGRSSEEKKRDGPRRKKRGPATPKNKKAFSYIKPKSTTKNRAKITIKVNNSSI